jgi:hypothetical protein
MHDGKEIKIRVERNTSSYWKSQLQWIW